jgi:glycosyltransferase involved in cell wall biosynthesis
MRIGFDARCLGEENISGVGEYTLELLKNILEIDNNDEIFVFSNSFKGVGNRYVEKLRDCSRANIKNFSFPNKIINLLFWYFNWPKIDRLVGGTDIFFAPNINFISTSRKCPLVATFHDLSFERYPKFFTLKARIWHKYFVNPKKISQRSTKIIAVSESTKRDLEDIYRTDSAKIEIISHGIGDDFKVIDRADPKMTAIRKKYKLPERFILYLGNIEPRKNIGSIISAYQEFIRKEKQNSEYKLVLAGATSPLLRGIPIGEDIFNCGYIEREERPYIYNLASLFVYPSFFEGFGLPLLEAMACGIPAITSHNSSLPEVSENAAILIDPDRPNELSQAMHSLITNEKLYSKTKERGFAQSQKFSWQKCAKKTLGVFEDSF